MRRPVLVVPMGAGLCALLVSIANAEPAAPAPAAPAAPATTSSAGTSRLDLSVPDIPAFTALGVSPSKVSQPTNVKDLAAALASGISPDGHVQSGLAIEVAPAKLVDEALPKSSAVLQEVFGGLRLSLATNAVVVGTNTNYQLATGARWSFLSYTPETDNSLLDCIAHLVPDVSSAQMPDILPVGNGVPPPPPQPPAASPTSPAGDSGGTAPTDPTGARLAAAESDLKSAKSDIAGLKASGARQQQALDTAQSGGTQQCRNAARAANLVQDGLEVAYVHSEQAVNGSTLSDFGPLADSAWLGWSLPLHRSYSMPTQSSSRDKGWATALAADKSAISSAWGLGATLFARYDSTVLSDNGRQDDVFFAARLSMRTDGWSIFGEGGYKRPNLTSHASPPATNQDSAPLGLGGDLRLGNGSWLGLYAGYDAVTHQTLSLGNIKWSLGETRPY